MIQPIVKNYTSKFSVSTLFEAWISPKMVIPPIVKIEVEPQVGGHFILHAQSDGYSSIMKGTFLEMVPNQTIKYTWHWQGTEETTIVTVEFIEKEGMCTISIQHDGFITPESREMHVSGWDQYMDELQKKLVG